MTTNDNGDSLTAAPQLLPPHISVGLLGRLILGSCAFLASLCLGAFAAFMAVLLVIRPRPVELWRLVLAHLLLDTCTIASIFMLLLAISFWAGGSSWIDQLLNKIMRKGMAAVGTVVALIFVAIAIAEPTIAIISAVWFIVVSPVVYVMVVLMRRRSRARLSQDI